MKNQLLRMHHFGIKGNISANSLFSFSIKNTVTITKEIKKILMFFFVCLLTFSVPLYSQIITLENGDQVSYDGTYYDFRDSEGSKMIKLWIPPDIDIVRGMFISGHGGGSGDSRNFARDENMRALAMRLGFAVVGLHNFPGRQVYESGAEIFFNVFDEFAALGHHPELANIPFVMYGSSNGGSQTYGMINYAPERAICFLSNVPGGGNPKIPVDEALEVPGIFIIGKFDPLTGQRGMEWTKSVMEYARPKGALWTWALELKGHEDGYSMDVYMKLVEQAVALRYPEDANPREGLVELTEIEESSGWLVDLESWDSGITYVDRYKDYKKDRNSAGWVLNKDMAYVYRSLATHHNPLEISVKEFDRTFNPFVNPGTMFSKGGPVSSPGESITIKCDATDFPEWESIEFFNGATKLGEVQPGEAPEVTIELELDQQVYCISALSTNESGIQRVSSPMHFFVKDPSLSWERPLDLDVFTKPKTNKGSKNYGKDLDLTTSNSEDSVLVAYALNSDQEMQFGSNPDTISKFWSLISKKQLDRIEMTPRNNARADAQFSNVITHDCNMTVKAAYGADGLYLLFEVNDNSDVAWPNEWAGTQNEGFYLNYDAVDMLLDSRSVEEISDPGNDDIFISRYFGLTNTTRQYQVACGTEEEKPEGFIRAKGSPWDFHGTYYTFDQAREYFGLIIKNVKNAPFSKTQEWFIPWSEIGEGFESEPSAGTRLAFSAGFNDRDEGEHMEPGVTSSGGAVKASDSMRWIGGTDPWSSGPASGTPPYAWGEIELGGRLK